MDDRLFHAAASGDAPKLWSLLREKVAHESINLADKDGKTLLHLGAAAGHSTVQLLLESGAQESINLADKDGKTPLHLAAAAEHSTVQLLLERGAQESVNLADKHGKTPLHLAAAAEHSTVQLLLERGAQESVNLADEDGKTPLHLAVTAGHSTVQLLLERGARESINLADKDGKTPLHLAATSRSKDKDILELLLERGARESINLADKDGKTPLHLAATVRSRNKDILELLLERGAQESINLADKDGKTPLHVAATVRCRDDVTVRLLLEGGAQALINLADEEGKTPLHLAAAAGSDSTVQLLLERGAQISVNLADKDGKTPLHLAAATGYSPTVELLLGNGAEESVNLADNDGKAPVHLAAAAKQNRIIQVLLGGGAQESINLADKDGKTPMHLAAAAGHDSTVRLLIGEEALKSINFADKDGKTSLHLAAEAGHDVVVRLLLDQGHVNPDTMDANGQTPLSCAAVRHHGGVVNALVANRITMNPDGSGLFQQVLADHHEKVGQLLLSKYFDNVARGSYGWLSDLRQFDLRGDELMYLVKRAMQDNSGPWISANISNVPEPGADISTALHQSYCAHNPRSTGTGDHAKNKPISFDRFSEYISRDDMQRRVSLFCGLAGVLPPGSGRLCGFGLISFLDERNSIKVIYSDHWGEPQPRNEDAEEKLGKLAVPMRARAKETATAIQPTPPYAQLISQLNNALRGFTNAAITLQKTRFCCDQFTVLTAPASTLVPDNVTTVHMNTIRFDVILGLAQDMNQLRHEGLDSPALSRSVSTSIRIMETLFQAPLSLPSSTIAHQLHLCSLTVQLLCLGIVFYSQAHVGKLHPSYLAGPLTRVEILGSSHDQPYIIAEQAKLACMGELVGDQVFVFRMSTRTRPIGVDGSFLSATCEEIVDSWGPASLVMDRQEKIVGLVIRGGIIQSNGTSDHGVRLFHWANDFGGKELPFGYKDKIVVGATIPARSSNLVTKEGIREGQNRDDHPRTSHNSPDTSQHFSAVAQQFLETQPPLPQTQHAVQIPVTITECPRNITKSYNASQCFLRDASGTKPSRWRLVTITANVQGGYQVLAQVGGEWQRQRGVSMKASFLDRWGRERKLFDFELPLGLQISLCTGVARRVPLRVLVREDLMGYVDSLSVKGWKDLKEAAKDAMESQKRFAEWSDELTHEQRTCVQEVFWHVLNCLKDTGFDEDGDQFSFIWPYKSDASRCVKISPQNAPDWLTVLKDKEWSATFAVGTNLCLATTKHQCRNESKVPWTSVKILSTSMCLRDTGEDPPRYRNYSRAEWQIENNSWYWDGEKNSRTWFLAQKSDGAIAEVKVRSTVINLVRRQITEELLSRILPWLRDRMRSRGALVEACSMEDISEEVFMVV